MRKDDEDRGLPWAEWRIRTIDRVFREAREHARRTKIEPQKEPKKLVFGEKENAD